MLTTVSFAAGVIAFLAIAGIPFLTKKRDYPASITSPPPLQSVSLDVVPPGSRLCMDRIVIEQHSQLARFKVGTYSQPGPPITVEINGQGYSARATLAGGYPDNTAQQVPVTPPASSKLVQVCMKNVGRSKLAFYAADERARSRSRVTVDGARVQGTPTFGFWEAQPRSIAGRWPQTVTRIASFRGPLGYAALVWVVLALTVLGLTAGIALALWRGFTAPEESPRQQSQADPPRPPGRSGD